MKLAKFKLVESAKGTVNPQSANCPLMNRRAEKREGILWNQPTSSLHLFLLQHSQTASPSTIWSTELQQYLYSVFCALRFVYCIFFYPSVNSWVPSDVQCKIFMFWRTLWNQERSVVSLHESSDLLFTWHEAFRAVLQSKITPHHLYLLHDSAWCCCTSGVFILTCLFIYFKNVNVLFIYTAILQYLIIL